MLGGKVVLTFIPLMLSLVAVVQSRSSNYMIGVGMTHFDR
jgi:hypothetical protein